MDALSPYDDEGIGATVRNDVPIPERGTDDNLANQFGFTSTLIS